MKKFTVALSTFVAGSMLFMGTGFAGESKVLGQESGSMHQVQSMSSMQGQEQNQFVRASKLMDKSIKNDQGEDLGSVDELVFSNDGELKYLILSKGGALGIGGKLIPVPFESVKDNFTVQDDTIVISGWTKDRIDNAPTVTEDELANLDQNHEANAYFGQEGTGITSDTENKTETETWNRSDKESDSLGVKGKSNSLERTYENKSPYTNN